MILLVPTIFGTSDAAQKKDPISLSRLQVSERPTIQDGGLGARQSVSIPRIIDRWRRGKHRVRDPHIHRTSRFQGAWIDGIKGKFKRGRRTATSYVDMSQSMGGENGFDRMSGDEELGEEKLAHSSNGQKRSRHDFELDSDDGQYESGEMPTNGKDTVGSSNARRLTG